MYSTISPIVSIEKIFESSPLYIKKNTRKKLNNTLYCKKFGIEKKRLKIEVNLSGIWTAHISENVEFSESEFNNAWERYPYKSPDNIILPNPTSMRIILYVKSFYEYEFPREIAHDPASRPFWQINANFSYGELLRLLFLHFISFPVHFFSDAAKVSTEMSLRWNFIIVHFIKNFPGAVKQYLRPENKAGRSRDPALGLLLRNDLKVNFCERRNCASLPIEIAKSFFFNHSATKLCTPRKRNLITPSVSIWLRSLH